MMAFPLEALCDLKPNWDSYGAPAIDAKCINKAYELWRQLVGPEHRIVTSVERAPETGEVRPAKSIKASPER